jgi:hypothetical protein
MPNSNAKKVKKTPYHPNAPQEGYLLTTRTLNAKYVHQKAKNVTNERILAH